MSSDRPKPAHGPNGRFLVGGGGGPGRPSRAVEMTYLAKLSDRISIDDWTAIVDRAIEDARNGDAQARRWLSQYLLGDKANLLQLAAREALGRTAADEIDQLAEDLEIQGDR